MSLGRADDRRCIQYGQQLFNIVVNVLYPIAVKASSRRVGPIYNIRTHLVEVSDTHLSLHQNIKGKTP